MTLADFVSASSITLLIFLAALGLGWGTFYLLGIRQQRRTYLWLATTCGLGEVSVSTLFLGMNGLLYRSVFIVFLVPLALYGLLLLFRGRWRWAELRQLLVWDGYAWLFRISAYLLLILSASSVLWILLTHALMPPHEWDEVAYHMTLPKLYVQAHRIIYVPFIVHSNWPLNNEMLFVPGLMFGSDIAPHLVMLSMAIWTAGGLLSVGRYAWDDRIGIVAVALFLTVPVVKRLAGIGFIDVAMGLYVLAAMVALHLWQEERRWPWIVICGACCGFVAGSKLTGAGVAIVIGLLFLIGELRHRPLEPRRLLLHSSLIVIAGLLMVGPWYVRSFLFTGNPIWPFAYDLLGGRNWDALGDEYHTGSLLNLWAAEIKKTPMGLVQSFVLLLRQPAELGGYAGGIGMVLPIGTVCALPLLWQRPPRMLGQFLFVGIGFYLTWFLIGSHQIRFLLPVVPLYALLAAYAFVWMYEQLPQFPLRLGLLLLLCGLVLRAWPWMIPGERELQAERFAYVRGTLSRDAWLDQEIDSLPLFRYANSSLPADARILLLPYENRTYYLDRDYIWGHPISQRIIPFEQFQNAEELAAMLQQMGITHVIENPRWMYDGLRYWEQINFLIQSLREECGQPLYQHGAGVVYALGPCQSPPGPSAQEAGEAPRREP